MRFTVPLLLLLGSASVAADPPAGALVIVGGGAMPADARKEFVRLAGGDKANVVVVPTASASADDPKEADAFTKPWTDAGAKAVRLLHTRDKTVADADDFVKPLATATAVWFSGGDQSKLTAAYRGTKAETALKKVLARGGVVGGTSAGAAVMSELMITGGTGTATTGPGFGFLPGAVVDQHFTERNRRKRLDGVIAKNPALLGIGIDEGTAVVVTGNVMAVFGAGSVTFLDGKAKPATAVALKAGDRYDPTARAKAEPKR